ncbi:MAG: hypothetical protein H7Y43_12555, partial [Akkermansiaceae bacterium]|nr:hypothetical protein [Verrucomicrobiales bacterium]
MLLQGGKVFSGWPWSRTSDSSIPGALCLCNEKHRVCAETHSGRGEFPLVNTEPSLRGQSKQAMKTNRPVPSNLCRIAIVLCMLLTPAISRAGFVSAWGENTFGQTFLPPSLNNVLAISAGHRHSLALRSDGTVVSWGRRDGGETNVPPGLANVVAIAAGSNWDLALKADGTMVAWGAYGRTNFFTE